MQRISTAHLQAKVDTINSIRGFHDVDHSTIGAVHLSGAYGGTGVHQTMNEFGGITDLMGGHYTKREANFFLSGMLRALRP